MTQTNLTMSLDLPEPVARFVNAVNAGGTDSLVASFADDAVVVDVNRELRGFDAIAAWADSDLLGVNVRFDVLGVTERRGRTTVIVKVDGTFDRTGLPDPLLMNHEFTVAEGKITALRIGFQEDTVMVRSLTGKGPRLEGAL